MDIISVKEVTPNVLLVHPCNDNNEDFNIYSVNLSTDHVEVHAEHKIGGLEMKELPGFHPDTCPFLLIRDWESICLLNTKEKNKVHQLIQIERGYGYNNLMAISTDA